MFTDRGKIKIGVFGRMKTKEERERYRWIVETLKHRADSFELEIIDILDDYQDILDKQEIGWADAIVHVVEDAMEHIDVALTFHPIMSPQGLALIGWLLGYANAIGVPVVYVAYNHDYIKLSIIPARTVHAHLQSEQELLEYDFKHMPFICWKGGII